MRSAGDAAFVPIVGFSPLGNEVEHKSRITDFLILWVFLVHDHVLQVHGLGKVSPCGPFGSIPWGLVLGAMALPNSHSSEQWDRHLSRTKALHIPRTLP